MKIYTRKGDDGSTGLWYGGRVAKFAGRPEAYGSVDEAASALGLCRAAAERGGELHLDILRLQNELFVAGAELATAREAFGRLEAEGLVVVRPDRGAFVAVLTAEVLREAYELRAWSRATCSPER